MLFRKYPKVFITALLFFCTIITFYIVFILKNNVVSADNKQADILAVVSNAAKMHKLPKNLSVPLASISQDSAHRKCIETALATTPTNKTCTLGSPDSPTTIILFGDSHANQWIEAFTKIAQNQKLRLITYMKSGCPPTEVGARSPIANRDYTECYSWRAEAIKQIKKTKPSYLVISALSDNTKKDKLGDLIDVFHNGRTQIYYLADTPYPNNSVPECLKKNRDDIQHCSLNRNKALDPQLQNELKSAAINHGAKIIDTRNWFCSGKICPVIINNIIVYTDGSHISSSYAKYLIPELENGLFGSKKISRKYQ